MQKLNLKIDDKQGKQAGITLIALVITVVVMLILAGVAIAAVVGGDGLFSKTREATEVYENAADRESEILTNLMGQIDHYLDENKDDGNDPVDDNPIVKEPAILGTVVTENQTYDGRLKGSFDNPIIPKGFAPINENETTWGSADGYQKGLVITDEVTAGESTGNEFVWIPIDGEIVKFERIEWGMGAYKKDECEENVPSKIMDSIIINGGFYIARFEAGKPEGVTLATDGTVKPISKQGATVWNNIQWGDYNDDINPGSGAVTVARSMYPEEDSNYGVASTLIYGIQWDTTLNFIKAYDTGEANYYTYATDSTGMGNYSGTNGGDTTAERPATCGLLDAFRQKNIYDMAGNVYELTMEKYNLIHIVRGGNYNNYGAYDPASKRSEPDLDNEDHDQRFSCSTVFKMI